MHLKARIISVSSHLQGRPLTFKISPTSFFNLILSKQNSLLKPKLRSFIPFNGLWSYCGTATRNGVCFASQAGSRRQSHACFDESQCRVNSQHRYSMAMLASCFHRPRFYRTSHRRSPWPGDSEDRGVKDFSRSRFYMSHVTSNAGQKYTELPSTRFSKSSLSINFLIPHILKISFYSQRLND
jgi:hypothetical protein